MKKNIEEVIPTLEQIREKIERLSYDIPNSYTSVKGLGGWCALTSYIVFHILKRKGYHPYMCSNDIHSFIQCDDYYVDLTATQFNGMDWDGTKTNPIPSVYVSKEPVKNIHDIDNKTDRSADIWTKICKGWAQPVSPKHPEVIKIIKSL